LNYRFDNPRNASASMNASDVAHPCGPAHFNGGYVGGNAGAVSHTALRQDRDAILEIFGDLSASTSGATAGAQLGWDWQSCGRLLGVVADLNWSAVTATAMKAPHSPGYRAMEGSLNWFSTFRGRAGLVVDDALIYVTGGPAIAGIGSAVTRRETNVNVHHAFNDVRWGAAIGVGAEFAVAGNWSVNTELLYLQFVRNDHSLQRNNNAFSVENQDSAWVSRIGLNYRWDKPAAQASSKPACGPSHFNGGYVGGNVGAIRRTALARDTDAFFFDNVEHTATRGGLSAGVQAGYDWQSCGKVFGVVADANFARADTTAQIFPHGGNAGDLQSSIRSGMDWFGTVRGRAGVAMDDTLVYLTGGLAVADIGTDLSSQGSRQDNFGGKRWGWTGGAGAEFALAGNWSVNGEVLYMQFAKDSHTFFVPNRLRTFESYDSAFIGRVGVNYRFGQGK
jgi:opacity protein-like surface antigen